MPRLGSWQGLAGLSDFELIGDRQLGVARIEAAILAEYLCHFI